MSDDPRTRPLSDDEVRDLLSATLHGALPVETQSRLMATAAEAVRLRERLALYEANNLRMSDELYQHIGAGPNACGPTVESLRTTLQVIADSECLVPHCAHETEDGCLPAIALDALLSRGGS